MFLEDPFSVLFGLVPNVGVLQSGLRNNRLENYENPYILDYLVSTKNLVGVLVAVALEDILFTIKLTLSAFLDLFRVIVIVDGSLSVEVVNIKQTRALIMANLVATGLLLAETAGLLVLGHIFLVVARRHVNLVTKSQSCVLRGRGV